MQENIETISDSVIHFQSTISAKEFSSASYLSLSLLMHVED